MFNDIGGKIKSLAVFCAFLGIAASIITGLILIFTSKSYNPTANTGLIIIVAGSLGSWIGSFSMYGFGELIEKTCENNKVLLRIKNQMEVSDEPKVISDKNESPTNNNFSLKGIVCPACNTTQPSFRTTCWTCGASLQSKSASRKKYHVNRQNAWMSCPVCGSLQQNTADSCTSCGAAFEAE